MCAKDLRTLGFGAKLDIYERNFVFYSVFSRSLGGDVGGFGCF